MAAPKSSLLPPELVQFLERRSYSLLIKGEAATGKTILALTILKEMEAADNYLYLSTRVSPSQLFENHPWLAEFANTGKGDPEPRSEAEPKATDAQEQAETKPQEEDRFVDARLDEPVPFFERITNELMDVRSPTIVVDSWDPIGMMMEGDALLSNTKVLQTWRERAEASLIVLVEDSSNSNFDSLFDGVLTLDKYFEEGRIVRAIQLSKLSGVKVRRPSYLFTLDGGLFRSFRTYNPLEVDPRRAGAWNWEKRTKSTGYRELDSLLDGTLPSGTIMSLNVATGVNSAMVMLLLDGILGRGPRGSRALLFTPFEGIGVEQAGAALGEVVPIQSMGRGNQGISAGMVESLRKQLERLKKGGVKHAKKTVLLVGPELLLRAEEEGEHERLFELMKSAVDLSVVVTGGEGPLESATRISDVSLKLVDIGGTPMLQAQLPWTEYFALCIERGQGPAKVSLVPMV